MKIANTDLNPKRRAKRALALIVEKNPLKKRNPFQTFWMRLNKNRKTFFIEKISNKI